MKKIHLIVLSGIAVLSVVVFSAFANTTSHSTSQSSEKETSTKEPKVQESQMANLFVTHGHCSTPFAGKVENLKVVTSANVGNPLENMQLSFDIDPESFVTCVGEDISQRVRTPGVFIDAENHQKIWFKSTNVYTMGVDWYQVNGILSIKGVEKEVKFLVSGIRNSWELMTSKLILEGQIDLKEFGIDYDQQVFGEPSEHPTQWMHINMKIDLIENS